MTVVDVFINGSYDTSFAGKEENIPLPPSVEDDITQNSGHEAARRKAMKWLKIAKRTSSNMNLLKDISETTLTPVRSQQLVEEINENIIQGVEVCMP